MSITPLLYRDICYVCYFHLVSYSRSNWRYTILMLVGVVIPWIALDILFFDEFFLLPVYVVLGSHYSEE